MISKGNISLRRVKNVEADMILLLKWLSDPEVLRWAYGEDAPWDLEKITAEFGEKTTGDGSTVGCFIAVDGEEIGYIQYFPIEEDSYKFSSREMYERVADGYGIDIFIGEPELWGQGIGSRAVGLMADWLKNNTTAKLVCADPATDNERGLRFWGKNGFQSIGLIENYDDSSKMSILMMRNQKYPTL